RDIEIELEVLSLPDIGDRAVPERVQRFSNRMTLRIEDGRFQRDEHTSFHEAPAGARCPALAKTRAKIASTFRICAPRSNVSSMTAGGSTFVTSASARSSDLKSACSANDRIALRCTIS